MNSGKGKTGGVGEGTGVISGRMGGSCAEVAVFELSGVRVGPCGYLSRESSGRREGIDGVMALGQDCAGSEHTQRSSEDG